MRCVVASIAERFSPTLNGSSGIRYFEHSDAIEIRDGIISPISSWNGTATAYRNHIMYITAASPVTFRYIAGLHLASSN